MSENFAFRILVIMYTGSKLAEHGLGRHVCASFSIYISGMVAVKALGPQAVNSPYIGIYI